MSEELSERERRTMTDHGRALWRDDVEGICQSIDMCFDHGGTVRCGPCAIKQASANGVETDMQFPYLPEVYRLRRQIKALEESTTAADERQALIVKWLRDQEDSWFYLSQNAASSSLRGNYAAGFVAIQKMADAIERGDHLQTKPD